LAPDSVQAGVPFVFVVVALDRFGNVATNYDGTVHFTSSDPRAELPEDYQFTPEDEGAHIFQATLSTEGQQTLTATDEGNGIDGSATILVEAGRGPGGTALVGALLGAAEEPGRGQAARPLPSLPAADEGARPLPAVPGRDANLLPAGAVRAAALGLV